MLGIVNIDQYCMQIDEEGMITFWEMAFTNTVAYYNNSCWNEEMTFEKMHVLLSIRREVNVN